MKRLHLIISGLVQGVGFRAWVRGAARDLKLVGWVMNREDGAVEIIAEGDEPGLKKLTTHSRMGPAGAIVKSVQDSWQESTG
ncbi:MAG: acylphosphatase, partial [Patescibacteria group bacterium]